ncbi:MAG TPA: glutamate--tRNA ligase [Clostridia bacterium]|nr:glutamate--tRNA ligase [Clostridia bacterium]
MNDYEKLAELLFPDISFSPEQYEEKYPPRTLPQGARVTRFAPSPTGFLHIGNLFTAYVNKLTAENSGGVFFLRIEDTDKKREVEDGVSGILEGLRAFDVEPDEGVLGFEVEQGEYGPYQQSNRSDIYRCYAKELVKQGLAYPCFCSEDALNDIRAEQELQKVNKGYYGKWALCRSLTPEELLVAAKTGKPYVLRLRSTGDENRRIVFEDMIKGKIEMPQDIMDIVLLKTDGIPTYHFAHAVDDHLMRTTHIIRSDEWIASVPLHIALFKACGFKVPKYAHVSPLMKEDVGGKRKLSKRKDPEAAVSFFVEQGFPKACMLEYLLTLINSNFEDWRKANPGAPQNEFPFNLKKMSASGALFDMVKLNDVSKNTVAVMTAKEVYEQATAWAKDFDTQLYALLCEAPDYARAILDIDRGNKNPRKDIARWSELKEYVAYFYDELYKPNFELPANILPEDAAKVLKTYQSVLCVEDDKQTWFAKIKDMCPELGYTPNVKEFKKTPENFKGHVGDISAMIRIALTSRRNTPDLHAIIRLLGADKVQQRMEDAIQYYEAQ